MKKKYIFLIFIFLVIGLGIVMGAIVSNKTPNNESNNKLSYEENTLDNEIQIVTTSSILERKENEQYIIKDTNGYIYVYIIDEKEQEVLWQITEIVTAYLPETDKIALKEGIKVTGKDKLNSILEDYE